MVAPGDTYYVSVEGYDSLGRESGPYLSAYYSFDKPTNANVIVILKNSRYYEKSIGILKGTKYTVEVTFDTSGTKLIQTFGATDTYLELYDSDGTTKLEYDDDDGYQRNALIYRSFQANKKYFMCHQLISRI